MNSKPHMMILYQKTILMLVYKISDLQIQVINKFGTAKLVNTYSKVKNLLTSHEFWSNNWLKILKI